MKPSGCTHSGELCAQMCAALNWCQFGPVSNRCNRSIRYARDVLLDMPVKRKGVGVLGGHQINM